MLQYYDVMGLYLSEVLRDGFGDSQPYFHVLIAELTSDDTSAVIPTVDPERPSTTLPHNDRIVGHALYFYTYCREGKCLYLQDLYVREEYRSEWQYSFMCIACSSLITRQLVVPSPESSVGKRLLQALSFPVPPKGLEIRLPCVVLH